METTQYLLAGERSNGGSPWNTAQLRTVTTFFGVFFFFCLFRAAPAAHGGSQARGLIGAIAVGLHHSHSNMGSELSCAT